MNQDDDFPLYDELTVGERALLREVCGPDTWLTPTDAPDCSCADCFSGKIRSVAGPGCSLQAHEYEEGGCWNCGASAPEIVRVGFENWHA